jgi:hypothetical protein
MLEVNCNLTGRTAIKDAEEAALDPRSVEIGNHAVDRALVTHLQTLFYVLGQLAPHTANDGGYRLQSGGLNRRVVNNVGAVHPSAEINLDSLVADF